MALDPGSKMEKNSDPLVRYPYTGTIRSENDRPALKQEKNVNEDLRRQGRDPWRRPGQRGMLG